MTFTRMDRIERFAGLKAMGCVACLIMRITPCGNEIHHLSSFGHAGMERRGDRYTISLGAWHHRGEPPEGMTATQAEAKYGPSLSRSSKRFREKFGSDDELLSQTDERLAQLLPAIA